MNIRNLALVLGAAFTVAAGGFAATACSSSNNPTTGGSDSGTHADTGTTSDSGSGGDDSGMMGSEGGTGADCGSTPTLHPGDGGSLYCPFGPDAGQYVKCDSQGQCHLDCPTSTTYCCIGGEISKGNYAQSACQTIGQACDNPPPDAGMFPGRPIQCEEAADCRGGDAGPMICCATGSTPAMVPGCMTYGEHPGLTATTCTAGSTCASGFQVCATNAECGSGKTCQAFKAVGLQLGFCM